MSAPETEDDQPQHEDVPEGGDAQRSQTHLQHDVCPWSHHIKPHEDNRWIFPAQFRKFSCFTENSPYGSPQEIVMTFVLVMMILISRVLALNDYNIKLSHNYLFEVHIVKSWPTPGELIICFSRQPGTSASPSTRRRRASPSGQWTPWCWRISRTTTAAPSGTFSPP